jgi:glucosamine--fructose-6-phosphate aminotransferase (isomerizing)
MEYRGYDSAGIALLLDSGEMVRHRRSGRIADLERAMPSEQIMGRVGIAHTRWATHGEPTEENAHPHCCCAGRIAIVHNGIIENHSTLRQILETRGHRFTSQTDTEVLAHLIEEFFHEHRQLETAVRLALQGVEGAYGIGVICADEPHVLVGACRGSPLIIGIGNQEYVIASDTAAITAHTRRVVHLDDGEMVIATHNEVNVKTVANEHVEKEVGWVHWDTEQIERGGYPHFMLKEIFEQPQTIQDTLRGRLPAPGQTAIRLGGLDGVTEHLRMARRMVVTGCGTSWHAGLVGEYMLEKVARIPTEVEYASELRYRDPVFDSQTVLFAISQSGETADTIAALQLARQQGVLSLGICNVVGSTVARQTDAGIYIHAGPEIGVASTKAFTSQLAALALLTLYLDRLRGEEAGKRAEMIEALRAIPDQVRSILEWNDEIRRIAEIYADSKNALYLGRGFNFPVALEGALKLKEVSYIHAEGYPAAEMKHGPIALIDEAMPTVVIAVKDPTYTKILSNIEEVRARRGRVIVIATEGDEIIRTRADHVIEVPETVEMLTPLLTVIPLQLLAYHIAVLRGCDVDHPRNLAKSVTVE